MAMIVPVEMPVMLPMPEPVGTQQCRMMRTEGAGGGARAADCRDEAGEWMLRLADEQVLVQLQQSGRWRRARACCRVRQCATTPVVSALARHLAMPGPRPIRHAKVRRAQKLRRLGVAASPCRGRAPARHHDRARRRCFGKQDAST